MSKATQLAILAVFFTPLADASGTCPVTLLSGAADRGAITVTFLITSNKTHLNVHCSRATYFPRWAMCTWIDPAGITQRTNDRNNLDERNKKISPACRRRIASFQLAQRRVSGTGSVERLTPYPICSQEVPADKSTSKRQECLVNIGPLLITNT